MNFSTRMLAYLFSLGLMCSVAKAGVNYEEPPINYSTTTPENVVSRLHERMAAGAARLEWDARHGYLPSLLRALDVPVSSQVLAFSKTSMQDDKIGPKTPRAVYFNDDVHIGYALRGVLEIAAVDSRLGMVFYTVEQTADAPPHFQRRTNNCLTCHGAARTRNVPGVLVRSVFPDTDGQPVIAAGSFVTSPSSPFAQRWGGWYVSGTHGDQLHLGNFSLLERKKPKQIENAQGQNILDLSHRFDVSQYLSPHSDIVALMVLEHQTHVYNLMTQASFEVRYAQYVLEKATGKEIALAKEDLRQAIARSADLLATGLLFANEIRLTSPIQGASKFANEFAERGRRNVAGRSLREFDLKARMFRLPCSYLVESSYYENLPKELRDAVDQRIRDAITGVQPIAGQHAITPAEQKSVLELLANRSKAHNER